MTSPSVMETVASPFRVKHPAAVRATLQSPPSRPALRRAKVCTVAAAINLVIDDRGIGAVANSETPSNQLTTERLYSGTSSFTRTVWLPRAVDSSKITAKLADGILTLKAPKMEDKESIKINVD